MTQRAPDQQIIPLRAPHPRAAATWTATAIASLIAIATLAGPTTTGGDAAANGTLRAPWNGEFLGTGARRPTADQWSWGEQHMVKTGRVRWNALGLARVNAARHARRLPRLTGVDAEVVEFGREALGAKPGASTPPAPTTVLPAAVDNSATKYFPPIRSQGALNSCAQFAAVYYTLTHMTAMARGWDAKTGGDALRFSPKWTYNMVNGGNNAGSWHYDAYAIALKHGAAVWADFPYDGDYRGWCLNADAWLYALCHRAAATGKVTGLDTDAGLSQLKQLLVDGYVLNVATYISSWQWAPIRDDPATEEDNAYAGRNCVVAVNGVSGGHCMTVVGYSDNLWIDANGNGAVDTGEKGALRIANSWGTGWNEGGYGWIAYAALRTRNPASPGEGAFWYDEATWVTARPAYAPRLVAAFTLNHAKRTQIMMALGASAVTAAAPSASWYPSKVLYYAGGALAFDGSTTARDGTFMLDMTDLVPATGGAQRYYLRMLDSTLGDPSSLLSFRLIDVTRNTEVAAAATPSYADGSEAQAYIDYDATAGSAPPAAVASADVTSGNLPVTVTFDGRASSDADGAIVGYAWNFGDGTTASGAVVTHTYTRAGAWAATLTVTDDGGATATATVTINAIDPYVLNAPASLTATAVKGGVALRWSDLSNNESGFHVERAAKSGKTYGAFQRVATVAANAVAYDDPVAAGSYQYRIQAFSTSTGKLSAYSNTASARVR